MIGGAELVTAAAPTAPKQKTGNCPQFRNLVAKYFPADQVENALRVMNGESSCRANAIGDLKITFNTNGRVYGFSTGLFQQRFLPGRTEPALLLDPERNVKEAADMYRTQNWRPWGAARKLGLWR